MFVEVERKQGSGPEGGIPVCLSVHQSICLSIHPSIRPFISLFVRPSVRLSIPPPWGLRSPNVASKAHISPLRPEGSQGEGAADRQNTVTTSCAASSHTMRSISDFFFSVLLTLMTYIYLNKLSHVPHCQH